jgi:Ssp1 endopeptidase immunity protein Rap1a
MWRQLAIAMGITVLGASYCLGQTTKTVLDQCREVSDHGKTPGSSTPDKVMSATACTNYMYGFVGVYHATLTALGAKGHVCFPTATTPIQLAGEYVKWGDRNKEKWQLPSWSTVMMAFQEAFPCK